MTDAWEPYVAAAFAPAAVWCLWRIQTLSVELLRGQLVRLTATPLLRALYSVVSWFGTFLHEVSHATVLLLSGHGIRQFRSGVEQGHVTPGRLRGGFLGLMSFLAAALAPLFIPPAIVLFVLFLTVKGLPPPYLVPAASGLDGAIEALRHALFEYPQTLGTAIANLDLSSWRQALALVALLLFMPASRPSHTKGSRFHGTQDEGDVAVLRARIRERWWLFLAFLVILYGLYFLLAQPVPGVPGREQSAAGYWYPFEFVWAVALTGILLCLFGAAWWSLVALSGRINRAIAWLPPAAFVAVQVGTRLDASHIPDVWKINAASLGAWLVVGVAASLLLPRRRRI
jgi:hypothetical protein